MQGLPSCWRVCFFFGLNGAKIGETTVVEEGQVVADGSTSEILENERLLTMHGLERP